MHSKEEKWTTAREGESVWEREWQKTKSQKPKPGSTTTKNTSHNCTMVSHFCVRFPSCSAGPPPTRGSVAALRSLLFRWPGLAAGSRHHKRRLKPDLCLIMVISTRKQSAKENQTSRDATCTDRLACCSLRQRAESIMMVFPLLFPSLLIMLQLLLIMIIMVIMMLTATTSTVGPKEQQTDDDININSSQVGVG